MKHPDVLVLGGGIIGLACARELAGAGLRVEVLERLHQGGVASRAAAGMLAPLYDAVDSTPFIAACRASRDLWTEWAPALAVEAGAGIGYDRSGALQFALDEDDEEALSRTAETARELGEPLSEITEPELRRRTPGVAEGVRRAVHLPGEHRVDNIRVCAALTAACQRRGVSLRYGIRTHEVRRMSGGAGGSSETEGTGGIGAIRGTGPAVSVETDAGRLEAGLLVLAAGCWSGQIAGLPPLPVHPVRGQMALLGGVDWPFKGISRRRHVYFVRRGPSDLLVGATVEEAGFHCHPTVDGVAGLLERARQSYPALGAAPVEAVWAGLRPGTPDGLPILGPLPGWPVLAATGHFRSGILLAPWTARQIVRLATSAPLARGSGEAADASLTAFSPARFGGEAAGERAAEQV